MVGSPLIYRGWRGAFAEGGGRESPRRARDFSLLRQRNVPKRKATLLAHPKGAGQPNSQNIHTGHRCARPRTRSAGRLRPRIGGRAQRWPVWMFDSQPPSVRAEKRRPGGGGCAAGHTRFVYWPTAVVRTERAARSEFRGAPPGRASQVAPAPWRRGRAQPGRLLFGDFLLAKQEKVTAPPGAHPGSRPQHKHAAYTLHAARCIQMLLNR